MRPHSRSLSTFDLLGLALRHYRVELKERVTRYKQVLLVIALLALPGLPAFKAVVLAPSSRSSPGTPRPGPARSGMSSCWRSGRRSSVVPWAL